MFPRDQSLFRAFITFEFFWQTNCFPQIWASCQGTFSCYVKMALFLFLGTFLHIKSQRTQHKSTDNIRFMCLGGYFVCWFSWLCEFVCSAFPNPLPIEPPFCHWPRIINHPPQKIHILTTNKSNWEEIHKRHNFSGTSDGMRRADGEETLKIRDIPFSDVKMRTIWMFGDFRDQKKYRWNFNVQTWDGETPKEFFLAARFSLRPMNSLAALPPPPHMPNNTPVSKDCPGRWTVIGHNSSGNKKNDDFLRWANSHSAQHHWTFVFVHCQTCSKQISKVHSVQIKIIKKNYSEYSCTCITRISAVFFCGSPQPLW